ncbi:MAG: hypothetical protein ACT4QF_21475 [Sporichthyaceae bacterium]
MTEPTHLDGEDASILALERIRLNNTSTADNWELYEGHRQKVCALLENAARTCGARSSVPHLIVMGAGNCNDVDLNFLIGKFASIHLLDVDGQAMESGLSRQHVERSRVHLYGGKNLALSNTGGDLHLDGPAVVFSAAILSQMILDLICPVGSPREVVLEDIVALRGQHLALMMALAQPGGACVLVNDLVSSVTVPGLFRESNLSELMSRCLDTGNFFTGSNPVAIRQQITQMAGKDIADLRICAPWIWRMGSEMWRLAYAISWRQPIH